MYTYIHIPCKYIYIRSLLLMTTNFRQIHWEPSWLNPLLLKWYLWKLGIEPLHLRQSRKMFLDN